MPKTKDGGSALTDEKVAKALGLKAGKKTYKPGKFLAWKPLPKWTTSLDAIVAEIEALGLEWETGGSKNRHPHNSIVEHHIADGETAPLALCAALLAYLKEHHD